MKRSASKEYLSIESARDNKLKLVFDESTIVKPQFKGVKQLTDIALEEIVPFIDWTPFFMTWELHGKFPKLLDDEVVGKEATNLYKDALLMLDEIVQNKLLKANAVFGIFEANGDGDDIVLKDNQRVFRTLRQQTKKASAARNLALSDYVAPKESGATDYVGCFAVTAGIGIEELVSQYEKDHDDYKSIMVKALADRLAEAAAEMLHEQVRKEHWGYAPDEALSNEELIKEKYKGVRPAPGYPACPDHLEKQTIFELLKPEEIGISLTESLAMYPAASVSGYYFAHPESKYFGLGKISKDQIEDYAKRKGISISEAEKWLRPSLSY